MGLMMLAAGPGAELHISAMGPQGPEALAALVRLVEAGFERIASATPSYFRHLFGSCDPGPGRPGQARHGVGKI